jgi:hypothetical protein
MNYGIQDARKKVNSQQSDEFVVPLLATPQGENLRDLH